MTSSESENDAEINEAWSKLETNKNFDLAPTNNNMLVRRKRNSSGSGIDVIDAGKRLDIFTPPTPYSLLVQSLVRQICNLIEKDKTRSSEIYNKVCKKLHELRFIDVSYERSEFENIRMTYETAVSTLVNLAKENLTKQSLEDFPLNGEPQQVLQWSRYYCDFEEIEKISSGGFGDVFKSRHKVDNNIYAIKKILIKSSSLKNVFSHLREVKTFASLNHVNIVPYKSCWLEPLISYEPEQKKSSDDDSWESRSRSESANVRITKSDNSSLRLQNQSDSFSINFEYSENHKTEATFESSTDSNHESLPRLEQMRKLNISSDSSSSRAIIPHVKLGWANLFIQMKLCQKTLRNFLDERNEHEDFLSYYASLNLSSENTIITDLSIFQQICCGLNYIHNLEIVHHDLKPGNVFVSIEADSTVLFQLGDFGLACPLDNNETISHKGFGTRLYAAKEQVEGKICSKKSDIYSLGIILIELLLKCTTVMECFKKVERIKKEGRLPEIEPNLCQLISRMLNNKLEIRPEIGELQQKISHFMDSSSDVVNDLRNRLIEKDKVIDDLMEEIKKLKKQLSKE